MKRPKQKQLWPVIGRALTKDSRPPNEQVVVARQEIELEIGMVVLDVNWNQLE